MPSSNLFYLVLKYLPHHRGGPLLAVLGAAHQPLNVWVENSSQASANILSTFLMLKAVELY